MFRTKGFWYFLMSFAIAGWVFSVVSLSAIRKNTTVKKIGLGILSSWTILHTLELIISLGIGKAHGLSRTRTIIKTIFLGLTWWIPLELGVFKK